MLREAFFRLSQQRRLHALATQSHLGRRIAGRFVAGESLSEAIAAVRAINAASMSATLDHLGENVSSREEARDHADACIGSLEAIKDAEVDCNVSVKLTQFGLDLGKDFTFENLCRVVERAAENDNFVRIDMEASQYVDATLELFYRIFERWRNVGVVLQSALRRTEQDLEGILEVGARVRLVKGAYLEPASVAFQSKEEVDANFIRLAQALLSRGTYPAIASHDPKMIDAAKRFAAEQNIGPERFEFQMLYGIRRDFQTRLVGEGYRMRIYVPYGTHWYPYFMRRLSERPANVIFVTASLLRETFDRHK